VSYIDINTEEVYAFQNSLSQKRSELVEALHQLEKAVDTPGWADDNQQKFASEVSDAQSQLRQAIYEIDEICTNLTDICRKAENVRY